MSLHYISKSIATWRHVSDCWHVSDTTLCFI